MDLPDYGPVREVPSIKGKHPVIQYDSRLNPGHVYEFVFNRYVERTSTSYYVCLGCRSMKRKDKLHQLPPATRVTMVNGRLTCNPESYSHFCIQPKKGLSAGKRALYTLSQSLSTKRPQEGIKLAYETAIDGLKHRNDLSVEEQHEAMVVMLGKGGYASKRRGLDKAAEKFKFYNNITQKPNSDSEDMDADEEDDAQWELAEKRAKLIQEKEQLCSSSTSSTPQAATVHVVSTALVNLTSIVDPNCAHLKGRGELVKLEAMDDYEPAQPSSSSSSHVQLQTVKSEPEPSTSNDSCATAQEVTVNCARCLLNWLNSSTDNWDQLKVGMISLAKEVVEEGLVSLDRSAQEDFWISVDRMARMEDKGVEGQKVASLQNQILLLFFSFFSHGDLEKKQMILKNLPNIATNQVVTRQILKFLFALSKTTSKQLAFEVVGELWSKYNWILNEAEMEQHFVHLDSKSDDEEALQLKMALIRRICKIQQGERFVPQLLNLLLLQPDHTKELTAQAILALTDLCAQSLLKVDKVRAKVEPVLKQAMKGGVKWPKVVAAYCQLLATSAVDLEDYKIALLYVEELWQLKDSLSQEVCAAAWNALAQFPLSTLNAANLACSVASSASALVDLSQVKIEEGISSKLTGTQLLGIARAIQSDETYKAFGNFLHKVVSCEIEELPRNPFYTDDVKQEPKSSLEENSPNSSTLLLVNLMPVLRETLENGGTAALDMAAYALAEPITKHLQPNTKKMAKCTHLLSYALLKGRADSNLEFSNTLNYLASWKSGMEFSFRLFHDTRKKTNAHFTVAMARDMFMDLMQKAMDQVKDAAVNVVCCLPFLWSTMNDMLAECTAESADLHWQISVVEYLLLLAIEDYQPKSLPIFQKETMRTCQLSAAAFLSLALILQRQNLDFYSHAHLPELILKNISSSCPSWMVDLIKGLLLPLHQLPALPTPRSQLQPTLSSVKLEPLEEGDLEAQQTSPPSSKAALSRVVSCLVNNEPVDNQEVDLLDVCEGRHNLKVLANILNVDPTFVANLLDELPCPHGLQDRFKKVAKDSNLAEVANLKTAFQLFSELAEADHMRFGNQFAKRIEKTISAFSAMTAANQRSGLAFSKNKNPVAECASCYLGEFYVGNLPGRLGRVAVKKNYKELPEGSVLKEVLNELRSDCKPNQKEVLLQSLLNQLRSDAKSLPPIDWSVLYSPGETSCFYTRLFQLAVEQRNAKLLAKLLSAKHLDFKANLELLCSVISPKLKCLLKLLPSSSMTSLLDSLLVAISQANYPASIMSLIHQLVANMADPLVLAAIWKYAPPLHTASNCDANLLLHPFYVHFADCFDASTCPSEFKSSLDSHIVQTWLEAKKRSKMNVQKIVTIFAKISSEQQGSSEAMDSITATSLLILAQCCTQLSSKERIAFLAQLVPMLKILKVSFHSKNSLRDHKSLQVYFDLLVAFVVSSPSLTGLPFFFLDSSKSAANTWTIATHRFPVLFREFATQLLAADRGSDAFKEVVIYLVELYPGLPQEQGKAVKACLRSCVNFAPQMSIEAIEAAGIWEELFL